LRITHANFICGLTFTEAEINGAGDQMFARPLRIAAAVVVTGCFVSTAAYAADTSPTPTPSISPMNAAPDQAVGAPSNQVSTPAAAPQTAIALSVSQTASFSDASLRTSIATQVLPTLAITQGDVVLARTSVGAKVVAAKWNELTYFWSDAQMGCLTSLWSRESHWNFLARNHRSGAYGIPQANPGTKMSSTGSDWRTNPITQIKWGMSYVNARYGKPCVALSQSNRIGWY
jgi:hypothetical protein